MKKKEMRNMEMREELSEEQLMIEVRRREINLENDLGQEKMIGQLDRRMIGKELGNVIKNEREEIEEVEKEERGEGNIRIKE